MKIKTNKILNWGLLISILNSLACGEDIETITQKDESRASVRVVDLGNRLLPLNRVGNAATLQTTYDLEIPGDLGVGGSAQLLVQPLEQLSSAPLLVAARIVDSNNQELIAWKDACWQLGFTSASCDIEPGYAYRRATEAANALNVAFGVPLLALPLPPNNVAFPLKKQAVAAGRYQVTIVGTVPSQGTVNGAGGVQVATRLLLKEDHDNAHGRLRVNLHWIGDKVIQSVRSEAGKRVFDEIFEQVARYYADAGIVLEINEQVELKGESLNSLSNRFPIDDLEKVGSLKAQLRRTDGVVDIAVVESLFNSRGVNVGGISYGIPGPANTPSVPNSFLLFSMRQSFDQYSDRDKFSLEHVMAHELGHFLGLYHTSDRDGGEHDPLTDTPECTMFDDRNRDGVLTYTDCNDLDGDNVMFSSVPDIGSRFDDVRKQLHFSRQQAFVMNINPLVR